MTEWLFSDINFALTLQKVTPSSIHCNVSCNENIEKLVGENPSCAVVEKPLPYLFSLSFLPCLYELSICCFGRKILKLFSHHTFLFSYSSSNHSLPSRKNKHTDHVHEKEDIEKPRFKSPSFTSKDTRDISLVSYGERTFESQPKSKDPSDEGSRLINIEPLVPSSCEY